MSIFATLCNGTSQDDQELARQEFYPWDSLWINFFLSLAGVVVFLLLGLAISRSHKAMLDQNVMVLRRKLNPGKSRVGVAMLFWNIVFSLAAFSTFLFRSNFYNFPLPIAVPVFEACLAGMILVYCIIEAISNVDPWLHVTQKIMMVKYFGATSLLVCAICQFAPEDAIVFSRQRLSFQYLLIVDILSCWNQLSSKYLSQIGFSEVKEKVLDLIVNGIVLLVLFGCTIYTLEVLGNPLWLTDCFNGVSEYHPAQYGWTIGSSLYFTVVTISTVGYGDISPATVLGRAVVCIFIVGGITFFGFATSEILEIVQKEKHGSTRVHFEGMKNFLIVSGNMSNSDIENFVLEVFKVAGLGKVPKDIKIVIVMDEAHWDDEQRDFVVKHQEDFSGRVFYVKGNLVSKHDLDKVRASRALAVFLACHPVYGDDSHTLIRCVALRTHCPKTVVHCLIRNSASRPLLLSAGIPPKNIVCVDEMKYGMYGENVASPGSMNLLLHLIMSEHSTNFMAFSQMMKTQQPVLYQKTKSWEMSIHQLQVPNVFVGKTHKDMALALWNDHRVLFLGESRMLRNDLSNLTVDDDVILQTDFTPYDASAVLTSDNYIVVVASCVRRIREKYQHSMCSSSTFTCSPEKEAEQINRVFRTKKCLPKVQVGETGDDDAVVQEKLVDWSPPKDLSDHLVVCFHYVPTSVSSLQNFLAPLYARHGREISDTRLLKPVVVMMPKLFDHRAIGDLRSRFKPLYFIEGNTDNVVDLMRAGVHTASGVNIFNGRFDIDDESDDRRLLLDHKSIFTFMLIESRFLEHNPQLKSSITCDYLNSENTCLFNNFDSIDSTTEELPLSLGDSESDMNMKPGLLAKVAKAMRSSSHDLLSNDSESLETGSVQSTSIVESDDKSDSSKISRSARMREKLEKSALHFHMNPRRWSRSAMNASTAVGKGTVHNSFASLLALSYLKPWAIFLIRHILFDPELVLMDEEIPVGFVGQKYEDLVLNRLHQGLPVPIGLRCMPLGQEISLPYSLINPYHKVKLKEGDRMFFLRRTTGSEPSKPEDRKDSK